MSAADGTRRPVIRARSLLALFVACFAGAAAGVAATIEGYQKPIRAVVMDPVHLESGVDVVRPWGISCTYPPGNGEGRCMCVPPGSADGTTFLRLGRAR